MKKSKGKGSVVDLCFKSPEAATLAAAKGVDFNNVQQELKTLNQPMIFVSCFLPIEFPDSELTNLLQVYGEVKGTRRLYHKEQGLENLENGCRVVSFSKLKKPIPVRLSYKGISIGFKYTGQPRSCLRCSSFEHLVAECPYKKAKSTTTINHSVPPPPKEQASTSQSEEMQILLSEPSPPTTKANQAEN